MKNFQNFIITLVFFFSIAFSATIRGQVVDDIGEPMQNAVVVVLGTDLGAYTDNDGYYVVLNIPSGNYNFQVQYLGYKTYISENIYLEDGEISINNVFLSPDVLKSSDVFIKGELDQGDATTSIQNRKKSTVVEDVITSEEISKTGDSNVAEAVKRISGVSVTDGKFAVVRGLSTRYTNTVLNGAPIPSPEADKKVLPLDAVPTSLLESIVASKTYTPDMPGSFAGGNINIKTKAYPDSRIFSFKISSNYKDKLNRNNYYLSNSSFFGFDNNKRSLPNIIPNNYVIYNGSIYYPDDIANNNTYNGLEKQLVWIGRLGNYGRSLDNGMGLSKSTPEQPISIGLIYGNKYNPNSRIEWGYFSNLSFSNGYKTKNDISQDYSFSQQSGVSSIESYFDNNVSSYNTNLGLNISTGISFDDSHKIRYEYLYSHISNDNARFSNGYADNLDSAFFVKESYLEKTIANNNLSGTHIFSEFYNIKNTLVWSYSDGKSDSYEPDTKSFYLDLETNKLYDGGGSKKCAYRDFSSGYDKNNNLDIDNSLLFPSVFDKNDDVKIKFGLRDQSKSREFEKRSFSITKSGLSYNDLDGPYGTILDFDPNSNDLTSINHFFDLENYAYYDYDNESIVENITNQSDCDSQGYYWHPTQGCKALVHGLILQDETANNANNAYNANEKINSFYAMIDFNFPIDKISTIFNDNKLKLIGGVRYEDYKLDMSVYNPITGKLAETVVGDEEIRSNIDEQIYLPSLTFVLSNSKSQKLNLSYSKTVNRPEFRELAPIAYQEFYGGNVALGYPGLKNAEILNYDLRYEWFFKGNELLSVGYFYKDFTNPIEVALISTPDLVYKTFLNAESAISRGIELEFRKLIPIIPISKGVVNFSMNGTFSKSHVSERDSIMLYNGTSYPNSSLSQSSKRGLVGHSDILINTSLDIQLSSGVSTSLSYNTYSKRLSSFSVGSLGNEYEFPYHSLNFTASKQFNNLKLSFKFKNILNSKIKFGQIDTANNNQILYTSNYDPGYSLSFSLSYKIK
tara:strand:+ start:2523 stop:5588 length:3066 start_codon:yes stop_codon:yes gene_type:complete